MRRDVDGLISFTTTCQTGCDAYWCSVDIGTCLVEAASSEIILAYYDFRKKPSELTSDYIYNEMSSL